MIYDLRKWEIVEEPNGLFPFTYVKSASFASFAFYFLGLSNITQRHQALDQRPLLE